MRHAAATLLAATAFALALGSLTPSMVPPAAAQEQPIAPETNPPGDIPDSQAFVTYTSPAGFSLKVPEGWALTQRPDGASFADKYGSIDISLAKGLPHNHRRGPICRARSITSKWLRGKCRPKCHVARHLFDLTSAPET